MKKYNYQYDAPTLDGFVQQLALGYIVRGYFYYVFGDKPLSEEKQKRHDQAILDYYDVARSKFSKCRRRKKKGPDGRSMANCQYLRHGDFWLLLCEDGHNIFFDEFTRKDKHGNVTKRLFTDVREVAIKVKGYSIGYSRNRLSVCIAKKQYRELKEQFMSISKERVEEIEWDFKRFPYARWGGVNKQAYAILKAVNRVRAEANLPLVPRSCINVDRVQLEPFEIPASWHNYEKEEHRPLAA